MKADPGSFRDPAGRIFHDGARLYRTINDCARADFEFAQHNTVFRKLVDENVVIASRDVAANDVNAPVADGAKVVEHNKLPFISYPYEWSFSLLQRAALHHLDLQIALLPAGVCLSDATAYNIQFIGPRPIFIDALSFQAYKEGDYWTAHRQFCEQFLNPLLMTAYFGLPHNDWFRGSLEGVSATTLARMIPLGRRFSWRLFAHVLGPAWFQNARRNRSRAHFEKAPRRPLPRSAYLGLLNQLRRWIAGLKPRGADNTVWSEYEKDNSYHAAEDEAKQHFIADFAAQTRPKLLWDFGCNTGRYAEVALNNGAETVVGFDFDHGALEGAYRRAVQKNLSFLALFQDAANPSPDQGWGESERAGLKQRSANVDGLIALAFTHHIAVGRNVPLDRLTDWLCALAPRGVLEFTPKSDPMVQRLLALRKDIFADYCLENFVAQIERRARIVRKENITTSGRVLIEYERD